MPFSTGILTGTYIRPDGTFHDGTVYIYPSVTQVLDGADNQVIFQKVPVDLDDAGHFSVALAASDDLTLDPSGVTYTVKLRGLPNVVGVFIPAGDTVDMADVTTVDPDAPAYAVQVSRADFDTLQAHLPYLVAPSGGDDTAAIQAGLATGRPVWLASQGTYLVASDLTPVAGSRVVGAGMNMTTVKVTGSGRGFRILDTPNVSIEDLTIDCNKAVTSDGGDNEAQQGIYVHATNSTGCPGTKIRRVRVKNSWRRGIQAIADTVTTNPLTVEVTDCESYDNGTNATGTGANGIRVTNATRAKVAGNYVARNGGYGVHILGCLSAAVDDNHVEDHANNHGIVVNNGTVDASVCGNRVFRSAHAGGVGQTQWGIVLGIDAAKFVVNGNLCDGNEGGITIDVAELDPSVFINTLGVVTGNVCINSTRSNAGLNVNHADGLTVTGNTVAYSSQDGISITGRNCTVVGNTSHHNGRRGIAFLESGNACGPHFYGPNNLYSNNTVAGAWTDYASDVLTGGPVRSTASGITASTETDTAAVNTTTNTTVVSLATGNNPTPEAGDRIILKFNGDVLNNTGAAVTYTFQFKLGTTTIVTSNALSLSAGANLRPFSGEMVIALAATNSQVISGHMIGFASTTGLALGTAGANGAIRGTAAEDLRTSKNVIMLVQMSVADANASLTIHSASLQRVPRR